MCHVDNTQASLFSLMRDVKDAAAIGTLLDHQTLASVTVAIEVIVAKEKHILLLSRLLGIGGSDKNHDRKEYKNEGQTNFMHEGGSAESEFSDAPYAVLEPIMTDA